MSKLIGTIFRDTTLPDIRMTAEDRRELEKYPSAVDSQTKVGIEIEVENAAAVRVVRGTLANLLAYGWRSHTDGSLRGEAIEYVTNVGVTAAEASRFLKVLTEVFRLGFPNVEANARTGVHIHLNVRDKTIQQVGSFIATYLLVEKSLFAYSGDRKQNIFCVPVRVAESAVPAILRACRKNQFLSFMGLVRIVPKYVALNLGAIRNFGSVELRHAAGTNDPSTIDPWLNQLVKMFDWATAQDFETLLTRIRKLNTTSEYETLMQEFLTPSFIRQVGVPFIAADMVQGSTFIKEALIIPEEVDAGNPPHEEEPDELLLEDVEPQRDDFVIPQRRLPDEVRNWMNAVAQAVESPWADIDPVNGRRGVEVFTSVERLAREVLAPAGPADLRYHLDGRGWYLVNRRGITIYKLRYHRGGRTWCWYPLEPAERLALPEAIQ